MEIAKFEDVLTVRELKKLIMDWPDEDPHGEACQVWVCDRWGLSNPVRVISPLNKRKTEDGTKEWADLLIGS